jgi:hypothetical protein
LAGPIEAPPLLPPIHGLLSSVRTLGWLVIDGQNQSPQWAAGFAPDQFIGWGCGEDVGIQATCSSAGMPDPVSGVLVNVEPFWLVNGIRCPSGIGFAPEDTAPFAVNGVLPQGDALTNVVMMDRVLRKAIACESKTLENALWTGGGLLTDNPQLNDAAGEDLGTQSSPAAALALLEEYLANCACGGQGVIHMSRKTAVLLNAANVIRRIDKMGGETSPRLQTDSGNEVIAGAGYDGSSPGGDIESGKSWMYATGPVVVKLGAGPFALTTSVRQALDRETNALTYWAARAAAVYFDNSCCLAGVSTNVPVAPAGS